MADANDGFGSGFLVGMAAGLMGGLMMLVYGCDATNINNVAHDCTKTGYHEISNTKRLKCSVEEKAYVE